MVHQLFASAQQQPHILSWPWIPASEEKNFIPLIYLSRDYISWNYCQIVELELLHCFSPLFRVQYLKLSGIVFKIGSISEENCALNLNFLTSYGGFKFMFCFTIETHYTRHSPAMNIMLLPYPFEHSISSSVGSRTNCD